MSFIDDLLRTLRAPLDFVRGKTTRVRSFEGNIRGNVNRIRNLPREFKGELEYNRQLAADYGKRAKEAKDQASAWQNGRANGALGSANGAQAPGQMPNQAGNPRPKRAGMGLFSKKKRCPGCNEKLDAKWELCPYCGFGAPESSGGGGHPRTMALDINSGGGGGHPRTMALDAQGAGNAGSSGGNKPRTMALDASGAAPAPSHGRSAAAANTRLVAWIIPLDGPQGGQLLELRSRAIVGTAPDADVVVTDPSVSGRHAEFTVQGSIFRVSDLGSTNGTFVNEKRIQSAELIDNDVLRLGRTSFKFKST